MTSGNAKKINDYPMSNMKTEKLGKDRGAEHWVSRWSPVLLAMNGKLLPCEAGRNFVDLGEAVESAFEWCKKNMELNEVKRVLLEANDSGTSSSNTGSPLSNTELLRSVFCVVIQEHATFLENKQLVIPAQPNLEARGSTAHLLRNATIPSSDRFLNAVDIQLERCPNCGETDCGHCDECDNTFCNCVC